MRPLAIATIFLNSFFLFLVQPLIAKRLLPIFGGSPLVWNASLLFFQTVLLLGYLWAHLSFRWFGKRQPIAHGVVILAAAATLPIRLPLGLERVYENALRTAPHSLAAQPALMVLAMLGASVGLPFFALSAGAPILQRWFSHSGDPQAHNPYFLYRASNLASMIALVGYPVWMERAYGLTQQSTIWTYGYALFVAFMGFSIYKALMPSRRANDVEPIAPTPPPTWGRRLLWIALSSGPSALLIACTTFVTANIAPIPLIWVVPLAIYLLTFVYAFGTHGPKVIDATRYLAVVAVFVPVFMMGQQPFWAIVPTILLHFLGYGFVVLATHCELGRQRPAAAHLTDFYLCISIGGVIGGLFASIVAPLAFVTLAEYPIAIAWCFIAIALASRPDHSWAGDLAIPIVGAVLVFGAYHNAATLSNFFVHLAPPSDLKYLWPTKYLWAGVMGIAFVAAAFRAVRFAFLLILMLIATHSRGFLTGNVIESGRSFFGPHFVSASKGSGNAMMHLLYNGSIYHGAEILGRPHDPITYYVPASGVGRAILAKQARNQLRSYAVVGLGTGTLAAYGLPGEKLDYYEIDPDIEEIAKNPKLFTFLTDCKASWRVLLGDARLRLREQPDGVYDLLAIDAFSGDSIPIHLLTKEAFQLYVRTLKPNGLLLVHVTNRYLRLSPVVAAIAKDLHLECLSCSVDFSDVYQNSSVWIAVGRPGALDAFRRNPAWEPVPTEPGIRAWTDDYSNVLSTFILHSD